MQTVIDVLKEKYEYEIERKRYYDNVITLPVSLVAFIVTGVYFIIADKGLPSWFNLVKPYLVGATISSTIVAMFYLSKVLFGLKRVYCSFPTSTVVLGDYSRIKEFYKSETDAVKRAASIENEFTNCIITWYTKANDENITVNDLRADSFHLSKLWLIISYVSGIIIFILYCITKFI